MYEDQKMLFNDLGFRNKEETTQEVKKVRISNTKKKREAEMKSILRDHERGMSNASICRKYGYGESSSGTVARFIREYKMEKLVEQAKKNKPKRMEGESDAVYGGRVQKWMLETIPEYKENFIKNARISRLRYLKKEKKKKNIPLAKAKVVVVETKERKKSLLERVLLFFGIK